MKRFREEFQGKSAVVTALSGIFSSENSYPRKVKICLHMVKMGDPVRNRKNKRKKKKKNREKTDTKRF